jgi:hypothetical protein
MGKPHDARDMDAMRAQLDEQQVQVLRALLELEKRVPVGEFETIWQYAKRLDFRLEQERNAPLRKALGL